MGNTNGKMDLKQIQFKNLNQEQLALLVSWAAAEGWNPGLKDAEAFWAADPNGYVGCFLNNELIGGISIVAYNRSYGFMGLFILQPHYRAHGLGDQLVKLTKNRLHERLKPGAAIGGDGVVAMQPYYKSLGFETAFRDERFERRGETFELNPNVRPFSETDFVPVCHYDQRCFGAGRVSFLRSWLTLPTHQCFVYAQDNEISGYAVLRKAQTGYKIGPLFANDAAIAEALYQACLNAAQDELTYLDIPVINKEAVALVKKYEAKYVFECARMYDGNPPPVNIDQVFGITSFELG